MALTRVQAATAKNTTFASVVTTTGITTTAGHIVMVCAEADTVAANGITITDSKANTWTRVISKSVVATFDLEIWYSILTSAGASHTFTATDNGGGVDSIIIVEEWSGQAASAPTDGSSSNSGTGSPLTAGTITTTNANDLIWVAGAQAVGALDLTASTGYSNLTQNSTTFSNLGICSQVVSATGSYNGGFTSTVSVNWAAGAVAIKQLAAATTAPSSTFLMMGV